MLDFQTVPRRMQVDYTAYLLAASPPANSLEFLSYAFSAEAKREWEQSLQNETDLQNNNGDDCTNDNSMLECTKVFSTMAIKNGRVKRNQTIKPIIIRKDEASSDGDWSECSSGPNSGQETPTSPCSPRTNKKVSFADHKGFALVTVRIMTEPSDHPPKLGEDVLKTLTNGAEAVVSGLPPFRLKFSQPASDYMAFRDKVDKNNVSLENVILRDYNVLGTIKVKNICFDKKVFIRLTTNSWKSSHDIQAKYVQPFGNLVHNFDTFSFEFDIDSQADTKHVIQFAVCFVADDNQFWDNNSGTNYEIAATDFNKASSFVPDPLPSSTIPSLNRRGSLSEYGCWHHVDTSSPYY
ncbi:protein phosphatase 1 regulatory subunit 3B-like [Dreissena polymorpha]|uniref:CBM21 domain-containing protein n=1 Tax=Dreissena polymorpha TaxID=45954 RepID=A0A9D4FUR1_DREPO|nr:protein phosphatase 1 regulatory subunit 3B-like [Dreissena polymorpha]KAH3802980.1 hypothetical protein DPMN_156678 [Dreissena polymorpha]